jgi:hypothetical protein
MEALYVTLVYLFFLFFLLVINYYVHLISTKDQYTKEELSNIMPYLSDSWKTMNERYSSSGLITSFIFSSLVGLLIPFLSIHWFFNSSILVCIFFLVFPVVKERLDSMKVSSTGSYSVDIQNYFAYYAGVILLGFGTGTGGSLMYNWANHREMSFLWFMLNLAVVVVLMQYALRRELNGR